MVVPACYADVVRAAGVFPIVAGSAAGARVPPGWRPGDLVPRLDAFTERRRSAADVRDAYRHAIEASRPRVTVVDPHARWLRELSAARRVFLSTTTPPPCRPSGSWLVNGLPELCPGDRMFRFVGPLHGALPTPYAGFPFHLLTGRRLLVAAFGTVFSHGAARLRAFAEVFRGTSWQVVLATGRTPPAALGPLPGNVLALPGIPQQDLLGRAEVFLTHGGMNSVLEAAAAGVPMVVSPRTREQRRTAAQLVRLGAGAIAGPAGRLLAQVEEAASRADRAAWLRSVVGTAPSAEEAVTEILRSA